MSHLRIYRWHDPDAEDLRDALALEAPREWVAAVPEGSELGVTWTDVALAPLDEHTQAVAGNSPPVKIRKPKPMPERPERPDRPRRHP